MFILDFDDTLFDTQAYKQERFKPLKKFGIMPELAQKTYLQIRQTGNHIYSNEKHARLLAERGYPEDELIDIFEKTSGDMLKKFVFDDTMLFLTWIKEMGEKLILVTLGDPKFQQKKIEGAGLLHLFDEYYFADDNKIKSLKKVFDKYEIEKPIWFINDKIDETQNILHKFPDIKPIMKARDATPIEEYKNSGLPFFKTLTEIKEYVEQQAK